MNFDRKQVTHLGVYENEATVYMRKNKCGQWNTLQLDRKGYRWGDVNFLNFPIKIIPVTQDDLKDHLFESNPSLKSEGNS